MILLDKLKQAMPVMKAGADGAIVLRVHQDVVDLAMELVARDGDKLALTLPHLFMPAERCWFEWPQAGPDGHPGGDMGVMFAGPDVTHGSAVFYSWKHGDPVPHSAAALKIDFEDSRLDIDMASHEKGNPLELARAWSGLRPVLLAFLALINSPKIVKRVPRDLAKLNRKRQAVGRYTYHPHHTVRLNVDRKTFTVGEGHGGDGASRALHFVRAHLRLVDGSYILVRPHWRGDPAVGLRKTSYEIDRQSSRWAD